MALDECLVQEVSDGLMAKSLMMEAGGGWQPRGEASQLNTIAVMCICLVVRC